MEFAYRAPNFVFWLQKTAAPDAFRYRRELNANAATSSVFPSHRPAVRKSHHRAQRRRVQINTFLKNFACEGNQPSESTWAELREAQTMALAVPRTGMAVCVDIGDAADLGHALEPAGAASTGVSPTSAKRPSPAS